MPYLYVCICHSQELKKTMLQISRNENLKMHLNNVYNMNIIL